jgi:hypothetical protein
LYIIALQLPPFHGPLHELRVVDEPEVLPQVILSVENPLFSISLTAEIVVVGLRMNTPWVEKTAEYTCGF